MFDYQTILVYYYQLENRAKSLKKLNAATATATAAASNANTNDIL